MSNVNTDDNIATSSTNSGSGPHQPFTGTKEEKASAPSGAKGKWLLCHRDQEVARIGPVVELVPRNEGHTWTLHEPTHEEAMQVLHECAAEHISGCDSGGFFLRDLTLWQGSRLVGWLGWDVEGRPVIGRIRD